METPEEIRERLQTLRNRLDYLRGAYESIYFEKVQHRILPFLANWEKRNVMREIPGTGYYRHDLNKNGRLARGVLSIFPDAPTGRPKGKLKSSRSQCPYFGIEHGSLVHSNIRLCVEIMLGLVSFDLITYENIHIDPCTDRFFQNLEANNIVPIYSELLVYDPESIYGTAIDLIGYDIQHDALVAIEIKTGFENEEYFPVANDRDLDINGIRIADCPFHRHQIQLIAGMLFANLSLGLKFDYGYVIRICPKAGMTEPYGLTLPVERIQLGLLKNFRLQK